MTAPRIGLGTVQWGLDYGIANRSGRPAVGAVLEMMEIAAQAGINLLDTARDYGEAEQAIGATGAASASFRIVTKFAPPPKAANPRAFVRQTFSRSLAALCRERVDTLMVHYGCRLLESDGEALWNAMTELRDEDLVGRLGVSVYDPEELSAVLARFPVEAVQLPYNIYDQRFSDTGLLDQLAERGIEVHVRSAFLQGLLLMPPEGLSRHFEPIKGHHRSLHAELAERGLSPVTGALRFCLDDARVSCVVVGCEAPAQLAEIVAAAGRDPAGEPADWRRHALSDEAIILPTRWPRTGV